MALDKEEKCALLLLLFFLWEGTVDRYWTITGRFTEEEEEEEEEERDLVQMEFLPVTSNRETRGKGQRRRVSPSPHSMPNIPERTLSPLPQEACAALLGAGEEGLTGALGGTQKNARMGNEIPSLEREKEQKVH